MSRYIIYKDKLLDLVKEYGKTAFVYYPIKANSSPEIVDIIDPHITGYEVDSIELLEFVINDCKISPSRVLYSSLINDLVDYKRVLDLGVDFFVIDSMEQLSMLCSLAEEHALKFLIRIDVSDILNCDGIITKWGCPTCQIPNIAERIKTTNHVFRGISFYLPQEIYSLSNIYKLISTIESLVVGMDIATLNVGGGMCIQDFDSIIEFIRKKPQFSNLEIIVEPGRYLLDPCVDMISVIKAIKQSNGKKLVFIDCGIYNGLIDCVIKHKKLDISPKKTDSVQGKTELCIICGITSDVSDVLGEFELPEDVQVGTELVIRGTGAYCRELETQFYKKKNW